jgi:hypothetical protein
MVAEIDRHLAQQFTRLRDVAIDEIELIAMRSANRVRAQTDGRT